MSMHLQKGTHVAKPGDRWEEGVQAYTACGIAVPLSRVNRVDRNTHDDQFVGMTSNFSKVDCHDCLVAGR